ncbi:Arsenite-translocating ATPase ArsA [Planctomycetales bacterium 10988]|nr:Arsenite-translocating ATPase ArsA [Planctomycetales bacterium 10988]
MSLFIVFLAAVGLSLRAEAAKSPNVLLIMTDDQGWGDIHSHGNPDIDTPVLDEFAKESIELTRFYVSPVCAPTRASLLTGKYYLRTGVSGVTQRYEVMRAEETTLAEVFRDGKYRTGCFGKWHNGHHFPNDPHGQGFEEFFGFKHGHWNNYYNPILLKNQEVVSTKGYITDVITDAAIDFIKQEKNQPFFCYVPYNAPHGPFQVPDRYFDKYRDKGLDEKTAAVYGMVENIDENVGRLLKTLSRLELDKNTIVIFLTDNGPNGKRYNGGMKGRKGSIDEGGVRVPFYIRWKGTIEPGKRSDLAAHIDLLPTLAELCSIERPEDKIDGLSLASILLNKDQTLPERALLTSRYRPSSSFNLRGALRTPQYRLVSEGKNNLALYDMEADPGQEKDIKKKLPEVTKQLNTQLQAMLKDVLPEPPTQARIPIGYPEAPVVEIPVVEGNLEGHFEFVNGQGWAHDWATGWHTRKDQIKWELDVHRDGAYEITLLYTAPPSAVGSVVEITDGEHTTKATLQKAYHPEPEVRKDRVPEEKRLMQTFKELNLGNLYLLSGPQTLRLSASTIKGNEVGDVGGIRIRFIAP